MTRSQEMVAKKMERIGEATCDVCGIKKTDCISLKKNWFTAVKICDSCGSHIFRAYRKGVSGEAD